jgi:AhpD family alkylhydroperoxidase
VNPDSRKKFRTCIRDARCLCQESLWATNVTLGVHSATNRRAPHPSLKRGQKMAERLKYAKAFPEGIQAQLNLGKVIVSSGLEKSLLGLVYTRASQLNGCAYCIDMHTKDARVAGETEQRLYALSAWRETPFFTSRERAALAWTEALTNIQQGQASDEVYEEARREFEEPQLVKLTLAITYINAWNRIAIAFRAEPGTYQPKVRL